MPLAFFGAFILGLPVYWVYLLVVTEEVAKILAALWCFFNGHWHHRWLGQAVVPAGH